MSKEVKTDFITPSMVAAAKAVFVAMAIERSIRLVVECYQARILKELGYSGFPLKDAKMLPADVFKKYSARCNEERVKHKLVVENPDNCPLLVAEDSIREAERALIDAMEPLTGLTLDILLCSPDGQGLEHLAEYIDLNLRLLVPYVRKTDDLLKEAKNGRPRLRKHKEAGLQVGH